MRHGVGLAVLLGNIVTLGDIDVVALLLWDLLALLAIVVGGLALFPVGSRALLLFLIGALLLVGCLAVLLLLVRAFLPVGGLASILVESLADLLAGMFAPLDVVVAALATVAKEGWVSRWVGDSCGLSFGLGLDEATGDGKAQKKERLKPKEKGNVKIGQAH